LFARLPQHILKTGGTVKSKFVAAAVAAIVGAGFVLSSAAQVKPDQLVKQRQAKMTLQGKYIGPLAGMAQGRVPYDAKLVQRNAEFLEALSKMAWDGFDPSTKDIKSRALPAVFTDTGKFKAAAERLEQEASKLVAVSKGGDEAAVKAQIGAVGKACSGCHDTFQEKQ
jgi:cytochrome c556